MKTIGEQKIHWTIEFLVFFNGPPLGVAVFSRSLLNELVPLLTSAGSSVQVTCSTAAYQYLSTEHNLSHHLTLEQKLDSLKGRLSLLFGRWIFNGSAHRCTVSLTNVLALPSKPSGIFINIVHDLNEFESTDKYGKIRSLLRRLLLRWGVKNSSHIICISAWARSQVDKHLGKENRSNLTVINNGAGNRLPTITRFKTPSKTVIIVGRIDPEGKNLWTALDCMEKWKTQDPDLSFKLIGGINKSTEKSAKLFLTKALAIPSTQYMGQVSDEELSALYSEAEFLLFLSTLEGFGMPPFEALRAGCPVIVHQANKAMQEIAGDYAVFINPELHVPSITTVRQLIANVDMAQATKFIESLTWSEVAKKYADVINSHAQHFNLKVV